MTIGKRYEGITAKGANYLMTRIQVWMVALLLMLPLCLVSTVSTALRGHAESVGGVDTTGMTKKEAHEAVSKDEKVVLELINNRSKLLMKVVNKYTAKLFNMGQKGWNIDTMVEFLSWVFLLAASLVILVAKLYCRKELRLACDSMKNKAKVKKHDTIEYDVPFTKWATCILTIIFGAHALGMLFSLLTSVWLTYAGTIIVLVLERIRFLQQKEPLFDPPRKSRLREFLSDLWSLIAKKKMRRSGKNKLPERTVRRHE